MSSARQHLIVAMDLIDRDRILSLAKSLREEIAMVKVGFESFVAHGPDLVRDLVDNGLEVFLDLKIHDIPNTAAGAARQASRLGARLMTVHAAGGADMIGAAVEAASPRTEVIAVTMLTSLDDATAKKVGFARGVSDSARTLAEISLIAGAHGLVCSALELSRLADLDGSRVVPGVRSKDAERGDQKRVATPKEAVDAGATWIVVGRPILLAPDPVAAVRQLNDSLS